MSKSTKSILIVVIVTMLTGLILIAGIGVAHGQTVTNPDSTVSVTTGVDGNDVTVSIRVITQSAVIGTDTVYVKADTVYLTPPEIEVYVANLEAERDSLLLVIPADPALLDEIDLLNDQIATLNQQLITERETVEHLENEVSGWISDYDSILDERNILQDAVDSLLVISPDTVYLPGRIDTFYVELPCPECPDPVDPDSLDPAPPDTLDPDIPDTVDQAAKAAYLAAHPAERTLFNWRHDDEAIPPDTGIYISRYVRESDQFGFVLYVQPQNTTETGPARYVTISQDGYHRNFTVGQQGRDIEIRFRNTAKTDARNGLPPLMIRGVITDDYINNPDRVLLLYVLYDQGEMSAYVDTEFKVSATYPGNTSTWGDYGMMINDEFTGERASEAVIRQIEFYTFLDEQDLAAKRFWLMHYVMNIATTELGWEPVPGATSYQIQVFSDSGLSEMVADHTTTELMYLFAGGIGRDYWYRVRAINSEMVSDWSETGTFNVPVQ